ncbi:SET domain-containing protein [Macrolepiota fuliginosa MF-IS2]|uniref:SET domain-containing protein n=1 Tax=Macrolepiota fuliginosa MF-IS2 TaxID=1400762 RepID=A0A9P5XG86_9AGAR|nr:SET domain-containing protein [Macrolepiota fuliginosa MF-IS2]
MVMENYDTSFSKIEWDHWQRADGTNQTWHRMHPSQMRDWRRMRKRQRAEIIQDSLDVELEPLSRTDIHNYETRLHAQAYKEKLEARRRYSPKLEEQMAGLLAEKLDPEWNPQPGSQVSSGLGIPSARGLRLSTIRQQRTPTPRAGSSHKTTPKPPSIAESTASTSSSLASSSRPPPLRPTHQLNAQSTSLGRPASPSDHEKVRKRKLFEVEGGSGLSRDEDSMSVGKGKAPMHNSRYRFQLSLQWSRIAQSQGAAAISFVNDVDDEDTPPLVPDFKYLERGYIWSKGIEKPNKDFQIGCDCTRCESALECGCQSISEVVNKGGRKAFGYTKAGLFSFKVPGGLEVIECNEVCACSQNCLNRVSQQPRDVPLEIFKTKNRGWGVRAAIDIVRGKVLGMYAGLLITRKEAHTTTGGYLFDLDGEEILEGNGSDDGVEGRFSVDSRTCGNWTRFVNHSCGPNMAIYLAVYDTIPATNRPYITFVARDFIEAGTELTVDYDPASAHDADRYSVKDAQGMKKCFCGSEKCRDYVMMC